MSYAVIHMQKIKMGGVRGIQNHNQRLKESHTNPDIDPQKAHLNKDLYQKDMDKTYYNRIRDRITELNLPKAVRKDAVTMCGFICTSDKDYFDKLPQVDQDRFFEESYNFLKGRYGEKNIVAATVHYDETTPHMHYYMVPVTHDGRLSAKDIFTKTELKRLQTEYPQHMKNKGFELERGISSERKHLSVQEFKLETKKQEIERTDLKLKTLQDKIQDLEIERDTVKNDLNVLKNNFDKVKVLKIDLDKINAIEGKYGLFSKNKITIDSEDFEELKDIAKKQRALEHKIEILERDNEYMKQDLNKYKSIDTRLKGAQTEKKLIDLSRELDIVKKYLIQTNQVEEVKDFAKNLTKNQNHEKGR